MLPPPLCSEHSMGEVLQYLLWAWRQQWDIHPALQNALPGHQVSALIKTSPQCGLVFFSAFFPHYFLFLATKALIVGTEILVSLSEHLSFPPLLRCNENEKQHSSSFGHFCLIALPPPLFPPFFPTLNFVPLNTTLRAEICSTAFGSSLQQNCGCICQGCASTMLFKSEQSKRSCFQFGKNAES